VLNVQFVSIEQAGMMEYTLTSGQVAQKLASTGVRLSAGTIQRYARSGRIPSKSTPGGRYRYNLDEVLQSLTSVSAEQSLSRPVLDGGLGVGRSAADSAASVLGRAVSAHVREATPGNQEVSHAGVPAALWVLLRSTSRRAVALT